LSVARPRASNASPEPATRSRTVCDTSTSPALADAATRAPMFTATPATLASRTSTSPVCRPARTSSPRGRTALIMAWAHRDRADVVHALLERGGARHPVGHAHPALVEQDQPREFGKPLAVVTKCGKLPVHVEVGGRSLRVDEIDRPVTDDAIGDVHVAAAGESDICHRARFPPSLVACQSSGRAGHVQLTVLRAAGKVGTLSRGDRRRSSSRSLRQAPETSPVLLTARLDACATDLINRRVEASISSRKIPTRPR